MNNMVLRTLGMLVGVTSSRFGFGMAPELSSERLLRPVSASNLMGDHAFDTYSCKTPIRKQRFSA